MPNPLEHRTAFLIGRLKGYDRGNLSAAHVAGAVKSAVMHNVSFDRIEDLLHQHGLRWDHAANTVKRARKVKGR